MPEDNAMNPESVRHVVWVVFLVVLMDLNWFIYILSPCLLCDTGHIFWRQLAGASGKVCGPTHNLGLFTTVCSTELSGAAAHILRAFQSGLWDTSWAQTNPCLFALRPEKAWFGCSWASIRTACHFPCSWLNEAQVIRLHLGHEVFISGKWKQMTPSYFKVVTGVMLTSWELCVGTTWLPTHYFLKNK